MEDLEAKAILAGELGDENAPAGTKAWAIATVEVAHGIRYRVGEEAKVLRRKIGVIEEFKAHLLLGYRTFEELCIRRLSLSPEQVKAIKNAAPGISVALALSKRAAQMVLSGEAKTQTEAAELFDISQPAVSKALKEITEGCDSQERVIIPDHLHGDHEKADFRKLSPAGQDRVRQGEPLNRVALAEGVRKRLSPLEQAQKAFRRLTKEDQNAFGLWLNEQPR
jgi:DNA-binding MarR family transcriptional regulator